MAIKTRQTDAEGVVNKNAPLTNEEVDINFVELQQSKVDKEVGKGLSTEDYTTAEKNKLSGIAEGAQVNVGTNLGQGGSGNSRTITSSTGNNVTVSTATTSNAGFMSTGDKSKLDGIAAGAQVNVGTNLGSSGTGGTRTITSSTGSNTSITYTAADVGAAPSSHTHTWTNISGGSVNSWGGLRHSTAHGYIDFGPANTGHAHIYTDRPSFYFNKNLIVNGTTLTGNTGTVTSVSGGSGLTGTVTTSGSLSVDGTVIRTTGNQIIGGVKTFGSAGTALVVNDNSVFAMAGGGLKGANGAPTGQYPLRAYESFGWNFTLQTGTSQPSGFRVQPPTSTSNSSPAYFVVLNTGNVGIGTTAPSQRLHVVGNILATGTVTAPTFSGNLSGNATTATTASNSINLNGSSSAYYDHRAYTSANNYLGGHYTSGGSEKPNSATFGAGKLKVAMLSGSNLGFGGLWNDVLWLSTYSGGDVKGSYAIVGDKYSDELYFSRQNFDSSSWGPGRRILHGGNYNLFSPTRTGGGASGTWGINITGNAATATALSQVYIAPRHAVGAYLYGSLNSGFVTAGSNVAGSSIGGGAPGTWRNMGSSSITTTSGGLLIRVS